MAKKTFYRQCGYEQATPNERGGRKIGVSWIEEKFAKVGKIIYFGKKRDDAADEDFFKVTWVGDNRRDAEFLNWKRNADAHQREHSDV